MNLEPTPSRSTNDPHATFLRTPAGAGPAWAEVCFDPDPDPDTDPALSSLQRAEACCDPDPDPDPDPIRILAAALQVAPRAERRFAVEFAQAEGCCDPDPDPDPDPVQLHAAAR